MQNESACVVARQFGGDACASVKTTGTCFCDAHAVVCPCIQCDVRRQNGVSWGSNTSPNEERKTPFETARGTILLNLSRALESTNKTPSDWNERVLKFYEHKEREFLDPFRISSS